MKTLDETYALLQPEEAEELAQKMNETDDWTYVVVHDPTGKGYSFIEIYDEDGEFVALWK